jgi:hypothetical protein
MLNAVQQRMVEEALVEKEVYEAMLKMRLEIGRLLGTSPKDTTSTPGTDRSSSGDRQPNPVPDLDDLPVGKPPEWHPAAQRGSVLGTVTAPARNAPQGVPVPADTMVPAEVFAVGDPLRDPNRQVAPFQQETRPDANIHNPFPQLGPKGRPLG